MTTFLGRGHHVASRAPRHGDEGTYYNRRITPNVPAPTCVRQTGNIAPDTVASGGMTRTRRRRVRLHDLVHHRGVRRFWRYSMGSVITFAVSQVVFLAVYGFGWASPQVATLWSFAAGIPVNYLLNRRWAWQRRGRPGVRDELLPYAGVIAVSIVASAWGTTAVDQWLRSLSASRLTGVAVVGVTFAAINGGLFVAKYLLLDRLVFRDRPSASDRDEPPRAVERVP